MLLQGCVGWITGASRGIGKATAIEAARQGASVLLTARNTDRLQETAAEIQRLSGAAPQLVPCDISDPAALKACFRQVQSTTDRLDFVVNNAGILREALIGMIADAQVAEVMATNVVPVVQITQFAARVMQRCKSGSIVNVASIMGRTGNTGQMVYSASKAAVIGLTKSAARELARFNIRVNAVAPGVIETDLIAATPPQKMENIRNAIQMGRFGSPDEVARVICLLASSYTSYVTGQVIGVDGGMWL